MSLLRDAPNLYSFLNNARDTSPRSCSLGFLFVTSLKHVQRGMEFLARLIGGSRATPSKKASSDHPQNRLNKFKRIWSQTLQAWHKYTGSAQAAAQAAAQDPALLELIQNNLQRLTSLLENDTRAPPPHLCLSFASSSYVYTAVSRIAISLDSEAVFREALSIFTILVDNDEDDLLATSRFAETLSSFADAVLGIGASRQSSDAQAEVLELIFGIAAKIRLEPDLLPVWFRRPGSNCGSEKSETASDEDEPAVTEANGDIGKIDFPLFHQFVSQVYQEGRVGDFARTGLLYLFESAANSKVLENWIVNSDVPTLMASGLGALYSQLSRKLSISHPTEGLPLILALSDKHQDGTTSSEAESFFSLDLQARLSTFMSYLVFWQDVLKQCYSTDIKHTLIDHFHVFFLQQILYPSLLESSDADGGSSVAVLTYLWTILNSIDHPDLIHMILNYLLALAEFSAPRPSTPRSTTVEKRRKSLLDLSQANEQDEGMTPSFFNLTDLILASCRSRDGETVTATLRLVSVVLNRYHRYAVSSLVRILPNGQAGAPRSLGIFYQELDTLINIAKDIGGPNGMDEAYENSVRDGLVTIESHVCSAEMLSLGTSTSQGPQHAKRRRSSLAIDMRVMRGHNIDPDDPLLRLLIGLLGTFFTNDVEVNLGLTSVLTQMASCTYTCLEGWLVSDAGKTNDDAASINTQVPEEQESTAALGDSIEEQDRLEEERIKAYKATRSATRRSAKSASQPLPILVQTLQSLSQSLSEVRSNIPEFDSLLAGRKRAFQGVTEIENEMHEPAPVLFSPRSSIDQPREPTKSTSAQARPMSPRPKSTAEPPPASPRGRALSVITGAKRTPTPSPNSNSSKRPTPLNSPSFRPRTSSRGPSRSPSKLSRPTSPLKVAYNASDETTGMDEVLSQGHSRHSSTAEEIFERKIKFACTSSESRQADDSNAKESDEDIEQNEEGSNDSELEWKKEPEIREATLTHVLTNVVILQEFILELAAVIHVRAGLLDHEVRFL